MASKFDRLVAHYDSVIRQTQALHGKVGTAGQIRKLKGQLVEHIATELVQMAWKGLGKDPARLSIGRKKVAIKNAEGDEYDLSQDLHVFVDGKFVLSIECKAYTEVAMFKRILVDAGLLLSEEPDLHFFLVQLENFLGGDYGTSNEPKGSESVRALSGIMKKCFPNLKITILTLADGDRHIERPIHDPRYYKPLNIKRLEFAIKELEAHLRKF